MQQLSEEEERRAGLAEALKSGLIVWCSPLRETPTITHTKRGTKYNDYEYHVDVRYLVQETSISVTGLKLDRFGNRVPSFQELIAALTVKCN